MMTQRTGRREEAALATQPGETGARVTRIPRVQGVAGDWEGAGDITGQGETPPIEARRGALEEARVRRRVGEVAEEEQGGGTTDFTGAAGTG